MLCLDSGFILIKQTLKTVGEHFRAHYRRLGVLYFCCYLALVITARLRDGSS